MPAPELELDERWFEVIARNETTVMTRHRITGNLALWRLQWRSNGDYPSGFAADAWAAFLSTSKQ